MLSADEAAALLGTRDSLGVGLGPAIPPEFMTALGRRRDWEDLVVGGALLLDLYEVFMQPGVQYRSGFYGPAERVLQGLGHRVELVPGGFRQFGPILAAYGPRVMATQGAPGPGGALNLSLHLGGTRPELLAAGGDPERLLVAEVNPRLPVTHGWEDGDNTLPPGLIDVVVEVDREPFVLPEEAVTDADRQIAHLVRGYVKDGSTLQTGIGAVPGVVAGLLAESPGGGYGVHSEMFTDGLRRLHESGKVTNASKGLLEGRSVATFALGSAELYRWLDGNREVAFMPVEVVNDPGLIARNHRMVSINGALAVDLYGQVAADAVAGVQISGVGGHEDFTAGTDLSFDGHSLVCLHSTVTRDGQKSSRIVADLPPGSIVSTPRHHLDVVITEHGAAEVRGLTVRERALALAGIADPEFRPELLDRAARLA